MAIIALRAWYLDEYEPIPERELAKHRIGIEHVIRCLKVFRILAGPYRNRRRRLGLRFNLIAGLYNRELELSMV